MIDGATRNLVDVLQRSVLFSEWPTDALPLVAQRFRPMEVGAGAVVCAEGQPGDEMYIIEDGRFLVEGTLGSKIVRLAELGPGAVFGEMAVVTQQPRSATVTALTDARLLGLRRRDFQDLARTYPELGVSLGRIVSERLSTSGRWRLANERLVLHSFDRQPGEVALGRDERNDIVLPDPRVSRFHAVVRPVDGGYQIVDLNSSNGTFVNRERVGARPLQEGDEILIGSTSLYFDRTGITRFSRGGGIKIDAIELTKTVGKGITNLDSVSLSFYPGELICIVGGSGTGKTTLMNALSGLSPATRGHVLYNGVDYYQHLDVYRHSLGYVPQDDIVHPELTVQQTLYYAARLRLPEDTDRAEIEERIVEVLDNLDLAERRDTEVRKVSGGQRKRVSIGVELLTKPSVFYLDEPTSGLDPGLDSRMMDLLRTLANQGRTVVVITHATRNVMICDKVVFMARGGQLAFFGPPADALEYFGVSDFTQIYRLLDDQVDGWDARYRQSQHFQRNVQHRLEEQALAPRADGGRGGRGEKKGANQTNWFWQFIWLSVRYLRILMRDWLSLLVILVAAPIIAVVYALIFKRDIFAPTWADGGDARQGVALLFNLAVAVMFLSAFAAARAIAEEVPIYSRERLVNLKIFPYVLSKIFILGLFSLAQSALLLGIVSHQVDIPGGNATLLKVYGALVLTNLAALALGLLVSALTTNGLQATLIVVVLLIPELTLGGATVPLSQVNEIARALSLGMISRWSLSLLGHYVDINARLDAQYPKNDFASQFDIDPNVYIVILLGFFVAALAGAIGALKYRDVR